jgi:hypothetical protein
MNQAVLAFQAQNAIYNVMAFAGADPTGTTDSTTAVNNALATGMCVLPPGTFLLNGATALALSVAGTRLVGAGYGQTFLKIGAAFSASEAVSITAASCQVSDIGIVGASATVTANPACNGIEVASAQHATLQNLWFQYVNGWAIESVGGASVPNVDLMVESVIGRNCAAGVHLKGVTGSNYLGEHMVSNVTLQEIGAASGANANLDAFLCEDITDVLVSNLNIGMAPSQTGSAVHVTGACAGIYLQDPDCGGNPIAGGSPAMHITTGANGTPNDVCVTNGTFEGGTTAFTLDAGTGVRLLGTRFHQAYADGIQINGGVISAVGVLCASNNQSGTTGYDINTSSQGSGSEAYFTGCATQSTVGAATAGEVTNPVSTSVHSYFFFCQFVGTNTTPSTVFQGTTPPQQAVNNVGFNPRGSVSAPAIGTSPYTPSSYQTALTVIFTSVVGLTGFAISGEAVPVPAAGVPFFIPVRETVTVSWADTTVAAGSNGGEISTIASWAFPSAGVLDVATTTNWPTSGTVNVAASGATTAIVTYAGTSGNSLTGCAYVSGSPTGTVATGGTVALSSGAPTWQWFGN